MKRSLLFVTAIVWLATVRVAVAQPTNPGFETGSFSGWLVAGTTAASVLGTFDGGPTEGAFQARVTSSTGSVTDAALETFLGLPIGTLDGLE